MWTRLVLIDAEIIMVIETVDVMEIQLLVQVSTTWRRGEKHISQILILKLWIVLKMLWQPSRKMVHIPNSSSLEWELNDTSLIVVIFMPMVHRCASWNLKPFWCYYSSSYHAALVFATRSYTWTCPTPSGTQNNFAPHLSHKKEPNNIMYSSVSLQDRFLRKR